MYSASHDDNATVGCFLHFHEIGPLPRVTTNPEVERRLSVSFAQSESVYDTNCPSVGENLMQNNAVPLM